MKIAINCCWGGFGVSEEVYKYLGKEWDGYGYLRNEDFGIEDDNYYAFRAHPDLIEAIEKAGDRASGKLARIKIIIIPDGTEWELNDYDGMESVHEKHESWS